MERKMEGLNFKIGFNQTTTDYVLNLHREIKSEYQNTLKKAIHLGRVLCELKWCGLGGGEWKYFLNTEFAEISYRTCAIYMELARNEKNIMGAKSIRGALKIIVSLKEQKNIAGVRRRQVQRAAPPVASPAVTPAVSQSTSQPETWEDIFNSYNKTCTDYACLRVLKNTNDKYHNRKQRIKFCKGEIEKLTRWLNFTVEITERLKNSIDSPSKTENAQKIVLALPAPPIVLALPAPQTESPPPKVSLTVSPNTSQTEAAA